MLRQVNRQDSSPAVFYFHPWEMDVGQPRVQGIGFKTRFRHYVNIGRMEQRLGHLLRDFQWGRMDHIFCPRIQKRWPVSEVASTLAVRRLDVHNAADAARWDAFVLGCPHATFSTGRAGRY